MVSIPQHIIDIPTALRDQRRARAFVHPFYRNIGGQFRVAQAQQEDWIRGPTKREASVLATEEKGRSRVPWLVLGFLVLLALGYFL